MGRMPREGGDRGDASIGLGIPRISSNPLEAGGEPWNRFFLTFLRKNQPFQHLDLELLVSKL